MTHTEVQEMNSKSDLSEAVKIQYLTAQNAVFTLTEGNMLSVKINGEEHPVVYLHCSFPHTNKDIYISVRTIENKEVGMIKSLHDFPRETVQLLEEQINFRYFAPSINKVITVKEEFGYSFWETETSAGKCHFTVRSGGGNIKFVTANKLVIKDVDGNRFIIEDITQLSEKEYRMVELCIS